MSGAALLLMVLIGGLVWGGFAFFLRRAVRSEAGKRGEGAG